MLSSSVAATTATYECHLYIAQAHTITHAHNKRLTVQNSR